MGLIVALIKIKTHDINDVEIYGDSLMVINQMNNLVKIKYPISKLLHLIASEISYKIDKIKFIWIPRKENVADRAIK